MEYIEEQLDKVNIQTVEGISVKFTRNGEETKWLSWEDVLNYLISKGVGE